MDTPATPADAVSFWPDAESIDPTTLEALLDAAWESCEAFLPVDELDPGPLPGAVSPRWIQANVLQARDGWTAYRREGDVLGFDNYAVRVSPLSAAVRALLRPRRGVPMVG